MLQNLARMLAAASLIVARAGGASAADYSKRALALDPSIARS